MECKCVGILESSLYVDGGGLLLSVCVVPLSEPLFNSSGCLCPVGYTVPLRSIEALPRVLTCDWNASNGRVHVQPARVPVAFF